MLLICTCYTVTKVCSIDIFLFLPNRLIVNKVGLKEGNKRRTSSVAVFSTSCVFVINGLNYKINITFKLVSHPLIQANLAISLGLVM